MRPTVWPRRFARKNAARAGAKYGLRAGAIFEGYHILFFGYVAARLAAAALQLATAERDKAIAWVPNLVDESVPPGKDDPENEVLRVWGEPRTFDFEPLPHWDLAERLGILDLHAGAALAGALLPVAALAIGWGSALVKVGLLGMAVVVSTRRSARTKWPRRSCMAAPAALPNPTSSWRTRRVPASSALTFAPTSSPAPGPKQNT